MLVGAGEVVADQAAHTQRLAVVRVVVARRQRVRAEHDAALDLGAESLVAGRHVHRVRVGSLDPQSIPHAVVAGEVARRLGGRDQVVGGEAVRERRHLDVDDLGPRRTEGVERHFEPFDDVGVGARGQIGDPADAEPFDATVEHLAQARERFGDRRRVKGIVAGDDLERQRRVVDGRAERPDLVEAAGERDEAVAAHGTVCRLDSDDAAQRGRLADRATRVAAEAERREPRRHGGRAAAR